MRLFGVVPIPGPRRLWRISWLRIPILLRGLLVLCLAIWFGMPRIPGAPFSTIWLRATVIGLLVGTILLARLLKWCKRRRAARALEGELIERAPLGDGEVLAERMQEALATLKNAGGKTDLYDLPWYVIIGPPGAGKTTALANAGIEVPGSKPDAVEGFGGTRNCDWWYAEDAVLIDTAGRYSTQDSGAEADRASWNAFLDPLKKGRPNQPINGVILAFSVEDMMNASETEIAAHAATVRARLAEIHERLEIDFPVYVLFTKADLIAGFREYLASFSAARRRGVWSTTFQTHDRQAETWSQVGEHFDALVTRLSDETIDRMSEEPDAFSRIAIFGLPGQMALMRDNVTTFLRRVFEPTRYKTNAILRGFHFTSGTQEGTPIDQMLGAMSRAKADAMADLGQDEPRLRDVVIADADPAPSLQPLDMLRAATAGYGDTREQETWEGLGLGQRERLNGAATRAYPDGLERMLRPRAILQVETDLEAAILERDIPSIYRILKVYLLLGGQGEGKTDDAAIQSYLGEVWCGTFAQVGQIDEREALEAHLTAILALYDTRRIDIPIDAELVARARQDITELPLAEQAYASIRDRSVNSGVPPFDLSERLGPAGGQIFAVQGGDVAAVEIPSLFTFEGYWGFFLEELTNARERLQDDQWVLGEAAARVDHDGQLSGLEGELHQLYGRDFVDAWTTMLDGLRLAPMARDAPGYDALGAAASPASSPLLKLVETVEEETRLTRLYDTIEGLVAADLAAAAGGGELGSNTGDAVFRRIYQRSGVFSGVVLDAAQNNTKAQDRVGAAAGGATEDVQRRQVERIAGRFEQWHLLLRGERGSRPSDAILAVVGELRDNPRIAAGAPSAADEQVLQQILSRLTASNSALPPPMADWLGAMERKFRAVAQDATISDLNRALNEEVSQFCAQFAAPLYPFGDGRHISSGVFGEFFAAGGRMDRFDGTWLGPHVTRTAEGIVPVPGSAVGDGLNPADLRQFEWAETIRAAFFGGGPPEPQGSTLNSHVSSSPSVELALLTLNGDGIRTAPGDQPIRLDWPSEGSGVSVELYPQEAGRAGAACYGNGRRAIIDFLRRGRAQVSGNVAEVTHQIGGHTITYRTEADSTTVPCLMPELSDFSCTMSLE
ncbi:type VI secretion system membrane subunit TssM [Jannaschia rubra]|uniref:type VI secretion system membrane subunit TssM n=1 Tax=Jannaschia rubra TaxID=282197 RepID=UPI0024923370|nr:type VI secretion system membrane subunit TssM [Jannaschia rubra]